MVNSILSQFIVAQKIVMKKILTKFLSQEPLDKIQMKVIPVSPQKIQQEEKLNGHVSVLKIFKGAKMMEAKVQLFMNIPLKVKLI